MFKAEWVDYDSRQVVEKALKRFAHDGRVYQVAGGGWLYVAQDSYHQTLHRIWVRPCGNGIEFSRLLHDGDSTASSRLDAKEVFDHNFNGNWVYFRAHPGTVRDDLELVLWLPLPSELGDACASLVATAAASLHPAYSAWEGNELWDLCDEDDGVKDHANSPLVIARIPHL